MEEALLRTLQEKGLSTAGVTGGGTTGGGFNLSNILGSLFGGGGRQGGFDLSNLLRSPAVGAGLLGAGLAQKEPGEIGESRQFLRNIFNEPTTIDQSELDKVLNQVQQRFIAGQPSSFSTAMSGPEIGAIREATAQEVGKQVETDLARKIAAAQTILATQQPNLGDALSQLGIASLFGGGQGIAGLGGEGGVGGLLQSLLGGGQGGQGGLGGILSSILGGGQAGQGGIGGISGILQSLLGGGGATGGGLSSLINLLGPAAIGGAGLFGAKALGEQFADKPVGGALAGAGSGALAGLAIGGPLGALVGALAGGLTAGIFGREERHAIKAANRSADVQAQEGGAEAFSNYLLNQIDLLGGDTRSPANISLSSGSVNITPTMSFADVADQFTRAAMNITTELPDIAGALGPELLKRYQAVNPAYQTLDDVPGLRQNFLDFMGNNLVIASNYGGQSVSDLSQGTRFLLKSQQPSGAEGFSVNAADQFVRDILSRSGFSLAGLARGGMAMEPMMALVGEAGPELALLSPGSEIIPLNRKRMF